MPHGGILQSDPQVVCAQQTRQNVPAQGRRDVQRGRSPRLNLVRAERYILCIYAFDERRKREFNDRIDPIADIRVGSTFVSSISSVKRVDEYTRFRMKMEFDLAPRESRGYWKYYTPGKWYKKANDEGKINNEKANMLFDSGAEISIVDTTFSRKVGCVVMGLEQPVLSLHYF